MKVLCLILLITISSAFAEAEWPTLINKYSSDLLRLSSFFTLPRTLLQAREEDWEQPDETRNENHLTTLCRKEDPAICLLFDGKGTIAGYQISIPKRTDTLNMPGINYLENGFKYNKLFGHELYSFTVYFDTQESIIRGGRPYESINGSEPETGIGLWIPLKGKGLVKVPRQSMYLNQNIPEYKRQSCYPKMGTHWFYNMTKSLQPQNHYPIFLLYDRGVMIGFGFNAFGAKIVDKTLKDYIPYFARRNWFETYSSGALKGIAPDSPAWMEEYADKYGAFTHHVFFVEKPWTLECSNNSES